ncbi:MAG: LysE family translocator [Neisseriaceae bacterium]|nr:LysE family translocator [Neisseriaceae bacterium]
MDYFLFIATYALISILPGINMMFAMSIGLSFGLKKAMFAILGLTVSLAILSFICGVGIGALIVKIPVFAILIKILGGAYLFYTSYKIYKSSTNLTLQTIPNLNNKELFIQGFICTMANPKAWIFIGALLPKFLDNQNILNTRLFILIAIMTVIECCSLMLYAIGGAAFRKFMSDKLSIISKFSAVLIALVAILLIFE